jgi:hypothetical protein
MQVSSDDSPERWSFKSSQTIRYRMDRLQDNSFELMATFSLCLGIIP